MANSATFTFRIPPRLKTAVTREAKARGLTTTAYLITVLTYATTERTLAAMRRHIRAAEKDRANDAGMLPEAEYNETPQGKARLERKKRKSTYSKGW